MFDAVWLALKYRFKGKERGHRKSRKKESGKERGRRGRGGGGGWGRRRGGGRGGGGYHENWKVCTNTRMNLFFQSARLIVREFNQGPIGISEDKGKI